MFSLLLKKAIVPKTVLLGKPIVPKTILLGKAIVPNNWSMVSYWFPIGSLWFPIGFLLLPTDFLWFPIGFLWFPIGFLWFPVGFSRSYNYTTRNDVLTTTHNNRGLKGIRSAQLTTLDRTDRPNPCSHEAPYGKVTTRKACCTTKTKKGTVHNAD